MSLITKSLKFIAFDKENTPDIIWNDYYAFHLSIIREFFPGLIEEPLEKLKKSILESNPYGKEHRWWVYENIGDSSSGFVGTALIHTAREDHPGYEKNKHIGEIRVNVDKKFRRKGYGTEILNFLLEQAKKLNLTLFEGYANNEIAKRFAEKQIKYTKEEISRELERDENLDA